MFFPSSCYVELFGQQLNVFKLPLLLQKGSPYTAHKKRDFPLKQKTRITHRALCALSSVVLLFFCWVTTRCDALCTRIHYSPLSKIPCWTTKIEPTRKSNGETDLSNNLWPPPTIWERKEQPWIKYYLSLSVSNIFVG